MNQQNQCICNDQLRLVFHVLELAVIRVLALSPPPVAADFAELQLAVFAANFVPLQPRGAARAVHSVLSCHALLPLFVVIMFDPVARVHDWHDYYGTVCNLFNLKQFLGGIRQH